MKRIIAIWAQDQDGIIGIKGRLPWHLPAELAHFKETTLGHAMVMGRVTFEGMGKRVLPGRTSIVLTNDKSYDPENDSVIVCHSVQEVLDWYQEQESSLFVIGGAKLFKAFTPYVDRLIRTDIQATYEGDTVMPPVFEMENFKEIKESLYPPSDTNSVSFIVRVFDKKE